MPAILLLILLGVIVKAKTGECPCRLALKKKTWK